MSCDTVTPLLIIAAYMDLTVKVPDAFKLHTKTSFCSDQVMSYTDAKILCQVLKFAPTKILVKEILNGIDLSTCATESCLRPILYLEGAKFQERISNIH